MLIRKTINKDIKGISKLMLSDLKRPNKNFPHKMILDLREHAQEENLLKELNNQKIISFVALEDNKVKGFIVGYKRKYNAYLDYNTGKNNLKEKLLSRFVKYCKRKKFKMIISDTFEFMSNYNLYLNNNFKLFKKEKITKNLIILWLKLEL